MKDPFATHMAAPDKEELVEIEKETDCAFLDDRPQHDKIEKLLTMQASAHRLETAVPMQTCILHTAHRSC